MHLCSTVYTTYLKHATTSCLDTIAGVMPKSAHRMPTCDRETEDGSPWLYTSTPKKPGGGEAEEEDEEEEDGR